MRTARSLSRPLGVRSWLALVLLAVALFTMPSGSSAHWLGDEVILPHDLEVAPWAESPMFFNPTNIDLDARGRVWVAEAVNYLMRGR